MWPQLGGGNRSTDWYHPWELHWWSRERVREGFLETVTLELSMAKEEVASQRKKVGKGYLGMENSSGEVTET